MSEKVVNMAGEPAKITPAGEPVQKVVDLLEEVLAEAKSGRLRAVGIAYVAGDYWFNARFEFGGPYGAALLGASAMLTGRLAEHIDGE